MPQLAIDRMWIELFFFIIVAALVGFGLVLLAPVSVFLALDFDRRPSVAVGVHFLIFKHLFFPKKKKETVKAAPEKERTRKDRRVKRGQASDKSVLRHLATLTRERETIGQTVATLAGFARKLALSADRYYIEMNLSGGLGAPDLTGQFYGLVQACRTIPSDSLSLYFHPNFIENELRGTIIAGTVFRINKILFQLMVFVWRLPIIKLIKLYRNYRKEIGNV